MNAVKLALLRGVCQLPAHVAADRGPFRAHGVAAGHVHRALAHGAPDVTALGRTSAMAAVLGLMEQRAAQPPPEPR